MMPHDVEFDALLFPSGACRRQAVILERHAPSWREAGISGLIKK
jgi:hypothetical protein